MKTEKINTRQGFALFTVLIAMTVASLAVSGAVGVSLQRTHSMRRIVENTKAKTYAEAGLDEAYNRLSTNFNLRNDPSAFPLTTYGDGSYNITVTAIDSSTVILQAVGVCGGASSSAAIAIKNYGPGGSGSGGTSSPIAWDKTLFAAGTLRMNGNGNVDGDLHSNDALTLNGSCDISPGPVNISSSTSIRINGGVTTPGTITAPSVTINGSKTSGMTVSEEAVPTVAAPDMTDLLNDYYNTAVANGQVLNGNQNINGNSTWNNKPGGVVWINGRASFNGNFTYDCIVIATGNISMNGNCSYNGTSGETGGLVSRDGTISINGNSNVSGLLYAAGDVTLNGNVTLYGQIISEEDIRLNGNITVMSYTYSGPPIAPSDPSVDIIGVAAWQQ